MADALFEGGEFLGEKEYEDFLTEELGVGGLAWGFAKLLADAIGVLTHLRAHFLPGLADDS